MSRYAHHQPLRSLGASVIKYLYASFRATGSNPQGSGFLLVWRVAVDTRTSLTVSVLYLFGGFRATSSASRQSGFWLRVRPTHPVRLRARFHRNVCWWFAPRGRVAGDRKHVPEVRPSAQHPPCSRANEPQTTHESKKTADGPIFTALSVAPSWEDRPFLWCF